MVLDFSFTREKGYNIESYTKKRIEKIMKKGMSIKTKAALTSILFMGILTAAVAVVGYKLYHDNVMESYRSYAKTVLEYAYRSTVDYSFGDMIKDRDMPEGYEELRSELNKVKDSSDIEYLYAIYFEDVEDIHSLHYAINAKSKEELSTGKPLSEIYSYMGRPCEEGGFEDDTLLILQKAVKERSKESGTLEGYSSEYGHMLNGYRVIYDSNDEAVGLICVEIDINRINKGVKEYVNTVIFIALGFTAIIILVYIWNTKRYLLGPILRITESSEKFVEKMEEGAQPEDLIFEDPKVDQGGELTMLADNVKSLADGVAVYMTNLKTATSERERIVTELSLATRIQEDMLPNIFPAFPERPDFDVYAVMDPAKEVGGDFYDFFLIDKNHLALVIADVSGKGIPAALFMMVSKILIQNYVKSGMNPAEVLGTVNKQICANNREEMFVTVWLGVLDLTTGDLVAANAGHEYPALLEADGQFELIKDKHGFVVGGVDDVVYKEYEMKLTPGSKLFLYTDGVPEAMNEDQDMFGTERMLEALNKDKGAGPEELLHNVRAAVDSFVGDAEQFDDLTMLCVEYKGKA